MQKAGAGMNVHTCTRAHATKPKKKPKQKKHPTAHFSTAQSSGIIEDVCTSLYVRFKPFKLYILLLLLEAELINNFKAILAGTRRD